MDAQTSRIHIRAGFLVALHRVIPAVIGVLVVGRQNLGLSSWFGVAVIWILSLLLFLGANVVRQYAGAVIGAQKIVVNAAAKATIWIALFMLALQLSEFITKASNFRS